MLSIKLTLVEHIGTRKAFDVELFLGTTQVGYMALITCDSYNRLDDVSIFEPYRRRGYAQAMIKFCRAYVGKEIYLMVYKTNRKAIALYKKIGFKLVHSCDEFYEATY
jgi:ribosomal protein S18 acetylase RimI-like enzyme